MEPSLSAWPLRWKVLLMVGLAYSIVHFAWSAGYFAMTSILAADFQSAFPGPLIYRAAAAWPWLGVGRDWVVAGPTTDVLSWCYGPVLQVVTLPFMLAPTRGQATQVILIVDYLLAAATFVMWMRMAFGRRARLAHYVMIACIWLNYAPLLEALTGREIEVFELFLVTVAIRALQRQREVPAGVFLGLASMTKFLPILFLPYLFVKGYRKACWTMLGVVLIIAGITQWLLGWQHSFTLGLLRAEASGEEFFTAYANHALVSVLGKMFTVFNMYEGQPTPLYPRQLQVIGFLLQSGVLAACGWFLWRWRRSGLLAVEASLLMVVMILVPTHANLYYLVFVLPALTVGFAYWMREPHALKPLHKAALIGAVILSGFLVPMQVVGFVTGIPGYLVNRVLQLYSLPGFGAILTALVMVGLHRNLRQRPRVVESHLSQGMARAARGLTEEPTW